MKLSASNLMYSYSEGGRKVLARLDFTAEPGSYWCIAGPNGSGKSTFLKLACGLLPTTHLEGQLHWNDRPLLQWKRTELAREVAFVPGALKTQFPVTISDFVLQGRYARAPFWAQPSAQDLDVARASMDMVGINALADASLLEISAGETQLAMIARALAQQPKVLVLDEATANLDLHFQARIFDLLSVLNKEGMTILIVSHDINLAAEFCPNAFWLKEGTAFAQGAMSETLTDALMDGIYGVGARMKAGKNPFTSRPKVFWS